MGRILVPTLWTSQPPYPTGLDYSNALTRGLLNVEMPGMGILQRSGAPGATATSKGVAYKGNGSSTAYFRNIISAAINTANPVTIMAYLVGASGGTDLTLYALADASSLILRIGSGQTTASKMRLWYRSPGNDLGAIDTTADVFVANVPHVAILRYTPGLLEAFVDGHLDSSQSGSSSGTPTPAYIGVGQLWRGSGGSFNAAGLLMGATWLRGLSNSEIASVSDNPYQLCEPLRRSVFVGSGVGILFDAAGNSGDIAAASSYSGSASWSGSNRLLSVDVSCLGPGVTVTAMTYGGANCTFIGSKSTITSLGSIECWRISQADPGAPAAGSNTLSVTLSGSIEFTVEWASYTGTDQNTPTETFNSAQATNTGSATDASVVVTPVTNSCWVHAAIVANDTSITANQTTRNNVSGTLGSGANEDNAAPVNPAATTTMSYTGLGITTTWAMGGYAIRPFAGPAIVNLLGQACL